MAAVLEESILMPAKVEGTRWVDHRLRALVALERNYPTVVAHLSDIGSEHHQDVKKSDAAKARGWLKKITSFKFILHMGLYLDILEEL